MKSVTKDGPNDVLVFCSSSQCSTSDEKKQSELEAQGIRVERLPADTNGRPDIHEVLRRVGQLEIASLMIEGGSAVNGMAIASAIVDKIFLYYAPVVMGPGSIPFATSASVGQLHQVPRVEHLHVHRFGEDFAVEGYLRDPYNE